MSTETPVAPVPADDQLTEEKVLLNLNEETREIKTKQGEQNNEKEDVEAEDDSMVSEISTPEKNESEPDPPVVDGGQKADDVPVETGLKHGGNADELAEPSPTKDSACEAVETVAEESPVIKAVEKSAVESLENETVDKIETEVEMKQEIGPVEDTPAEKLEIEAAAKEEEEKVAKYERVEREADKDETIEAGENEAVEYPIACEADEKEEEEERKAAIEQVRREADMAEAIEAGENEPIEAIASEEVEKESDKTQEIGKQIDGGDDDKPEKPRAETFGANPPIDEASGQSEGPSVVKDSEICVTEVEAKSHEQLKILLEIERGNTEKVLKPDEECVKEVKEDTKLTHEENPASENADKEAAGEVTDTRLAKEENKIVKTEEEDEDDAQEKKKNELEKIEVEHVNVKVGDRDLVESKEGKEGKEGEVYKDIKEHEEGLGCGIEDNTNGSGAKREDIEAAKDEAKADVSVKAGQKQSGGGGGIISKVKQSIVKVKKAIIGKSPSSKLLSPQIKAEEQVK